MADEAEKVGKMQRPLKVQEKELASTSRALEATKADMKENAHDCGRQEFELKSACAPFSRVRGSCEISSGGCVLGTFFY